MGKYNLNVNDKLDEKFRKTVAKKKGMKKGNITKALEEAMVLWIDSV